MPSPVGLCDTQEEQRPLLAGTRIPRLLAPSAGSVNAHTPGTRGNSLSECFRLLLTPGQTEHQVSHPISSCRRPSMPRPLPDIRDLSGLPGLLLV